VENVGFILRGSERYEVRTMGREDGKRTNTKWLAGSRVTPAVVAQRVLIYVVLLLQGNPTPVKPQWRLTHLQLDAKAIKPMSSFLQAPQFAHETFSLMFGHISPMDSTAFTLIRSSVLRVAVLILCYFVIL